VKSVGELQSAIKRASGSKVAVQIQRGGTQAFISIPKD